MKITKQTLRKLIQEELEEVIGEYTDKYRPFEGTGNPCKGTKMLYKGRCRYPPGVKKATEKEFGLSPEESEEFIETGGLPLKSEKKIDERKLRHLIRKEIKRSGGC